MKRIITILIAALTLITVNAQRKMVVQKTNGTTSTINVDDINNVKFNSSSRAMTSNSTSGSSTNWSIDNVTKVYFEGEPASTKDLSVSISNLVILNNSFTMEFKFGTDVSTRRIISFSSSSSLANMSTDNLKTYMENYSKSYTYDYNIYSAGNLKENTKYYVVILTYDSNGNSSDLISYYLTTGTSTSQPRVSISNLTCTSSKATFSTTMNNYCSSYYLGAWSSNSHFDDYDSYVAYLIKDDGDLCTTSSSWTSSGSSSYFEVITWGRSSDGTMSYVVDRAQVASSSSSKSSNITQSDEMTVLELTQDDVQRDREKIIVVKSFE